MTVLENIKNFINKEHTLLKFKETYNLDTQIKILRYRWTFKVHLKTLTFGFLREFKDFDLNWDETGEMYVVNYNPYFKWKKWGYWTIYYDATVHSFNLGNIQFYWV